MYQLTISSETWQLSRPFEISGHTWHSVDCLVVTLSDGMVSGRAEAQGVYYLSETIPSMTQQIEHVRVKIESGITRLELQSILPPGGARNAIDCALWDLECKRQQKSIWQLTNINSGTVETVFTIGLEDTPEAMATKAKTAPTKILKVKLNDDRPVARLQAIIHARPDARLVVDANQAWDLHTLKTVVDAFQDTSLEMIEQPLPRGQDHVLADYHSAITLAGDESCLHSAELAHAKDCYQMVNIKLDKTGGLTEALQMAEKAKAMNLKLMVGNMCGTSLAMAPAFVIAQLCDFVDIDGPLLNLTDRPNALTYEQGQVSGLKPTLWG